MIEKNEAFLHLCLPESTSGSGLIQRKHTNEPTSLVFLFYITPGWKTDISHHCGSRLRSHRDGMSDKRVKAQV